MRRRFFTRPAYQAMYISTFVLAAFFISTVLTLYGATTLWLAKTSIALSEDQILGLSIALRRFLWTGAVGGAILSLLAGALGFYLSTRSAGPMSRVEAWLEHRLLGIDPAKLKLRPRDEFAPVIRLLNEIK